MDLFAAHHKSGQLVERACAGTGITPEDFAFVSIVGRHGLLTPTEISRDYGLSLSTVLFRANRTVEVVRTPVTPGMQAIAFNRSTGVPVIRYLSSFAV